MSNLVTVTEGEAEMPLRGSKPPHEEVGWTRVEKRRAKKDRKARAKEEAIEKGRQLRFIQTIEPEGVNRVSDAWECVDMAVDSGATETVLHEDMLTSVELKEGAASKRGVKYEVATGVRIPNLGEKKFEGVSEEGITRNITAQVCEVNKALLSVHKVVMAGNRVVFDKEGSYVEHKDSKEKMWMTEQGGMYMLKLWVITGF